MTANQITLLLVVVIIVISASVSVFLFLKAHLDGTVQTHGPRKLRDGVDPIALQQIQNAGRLFTDHGI